MKVLFIVTAYPRGPGDVITPWLVETIHRLRERGVDVEVLAPSYRALGTHTVAGVRVHRFRYAPGPLETLTHDQTAPDRIRERPWYLGLVPSYVVSGMRAAAQLARSGEFDLLHAFWPLPHGLLGLAAKRASGVPLVSTFFGVELTWMESQLPFLRPVLRGIVRGSDAVTTISSYTAAQLERSVPGVDPVTIPFGATVEPPEEIAPASADRYGALELLFVGRLVERKGVHRLLEAMARLPQHARAHLQIIGDGPERLRLEAMADDLGLGSQVRFAGFVPQERLRRAILDADTLVLPAVYDRKGDVEGLGVVLIEALGYARPVIASRAGGITDIVRDGENGILVPPDDPDALASAILWVGENREKARAMGLAGRAHVQREFSWPVIIDRLTELYREVRASSRLGTDPRMLTDNDPPRRGYRP